MTRQDLPYVFLTFIWGAIFAQTVSAQGQQWTSFRNAFGGEDVYLDGMPAYSTRRNVFGGRDWMDGNHRLPSIAPSPVYKSVPHYDINGPAQQWMSFDNAFGGEDVYLDGVPVYSTRQNAFGGRDWMDGYHRLPSLAPSPAYGSSPPYGTHYGIQGPAQQWNHWGNRVNY